MRPTPRRTTTKLLRLHPEELARITARAHASGQTPARFIRETALGTVPKPRPHGDTDSVLCELVRISRRLDRLLHLAQAGQLPALADRLGTALHSHRALVRQLARDRRSAMRASAR